MRKFCCAGLVLVLACAGALFTSRAEGVNYLKGDYVEVRTASVFAGACHYNGELTTSGREAVIVWNVTEGSWDGVDLAGVSALAAVSADANLSDPRAARRTELVVDDGATYAQKLAIVNALKSRHAALLGRVVSVRSAPVTFRREAGSYSAGAPGALVQVEAMPDDLCCRMPQLVWYEPLAPLSGRKVGYTVKALYGGGAAGDSWQRTGENSAFYGSFSY